MNLEPAIAAARDPRSPEAIRKKRGPDVRLVPIAAGIWFNVAWTIVARSALPAVICGGLAVLAAGILVWQNWGAGAASERVKSPRELVRKRIVGFACWQVLVFAVTAAAASGLAAGRVAHIDSHPWLADRKTTNSSVAHYRGEVTVAGLPRLLKGGRVQVPVTVTGVGSMPMFADTDKLRELNPDQASPGKPLSVLLVPGQRVEVSAAVRRSNEPALTPLVMSAQRDVRALPNGQPRGLWAMAQRLRTGLLDNVAWLPANSRTLVPGMVMGDVSMQTPDVRQQFVDTGLSHLSAVSGSNTSILASSIMVIATAWGARRRTKTVITALALCSFVVVVGPEPSVLRATVMGLIGVVAVATARWKDVLVALSVSIIVLLVIDPNLAVSYGFALSVAATTGISILAPRWSTALLRWWGRKTQHYFHRAPKQWEGQFVRMIMVAVAADVVTIPVIAHMTGSIPLVTVVANLLVLWAIPTITTVGMVLSVCGALTHAVGWGTGATQWLAVVLLAPAEWVAFIAKTLSVSPKVMVPQSWSGAVLTSLVLGILLRCIRRPSCGKTRCMWPVMFLVLVVMGRVGIVGVDIPKKTWVAPREVTVTAGEIVSVPDEARVVGGMEVKLDSKGESAKREAGKPGAIVVEECGKPVERPTFTVDGIPVYYPCRNGTMVKRQERDGAQF